MTVDPDCELCQAALLTKRYFDDDLCWVADCESCSVPMIVWREHDADPPDDVRTRLHDRLARVVGDHFEDEIWIDDNLRSIPTHYHAHARSRRGFFGQPLRPITTTSEGTT